MTEPVQRIRVAVLGATGSVGQRFLQLLAEHPWFECTELAASPRNAGKTYGEAVTWSLDSPMPAQFAALELRAADAALDVALVFSALDAAVAGPIERLHAERGALVVSNASSHRLTAGVPLIVPEINPDHLDLLASQAWAPGGIVTNPNCSTIGLALALAPLHRTFGLRAVQVTTLQAISGAGLAGSSNAALIDNVIPFIAGEEHKLATETCKLFGELAGGDVHPAELPLSAHCNRVPVSDGHTICVTVKLERAASAEELIELWDNFRAVPQELGLPSAPARPTVYLRDDDAPQAREHRDVEAGMATVIGRLRPCPVLDWRFVCLSHNTLRGAAGGALLVAEMLVARGHTGSGSSGTSGR